MNVGLNVLASISTFATAAAIFSYLNVFKRQNVFINEQRVGYLDIPWKQNTAKCPNTSFLIYMYWSLNITQLFSFERCGYNYSC